MNYRCLVFFTGILVQPTNDLVPLPHPCITLFQLYSYNPLRRPFPLHPPPPLVYVPYLLSHRS